VFVPSWPVPSIGCGFLLALELATASACRATQKRSEPLVIWRKLGAWSRHGSTQTESFVSDTGSLRVPWETRESARQAPAGRGTFRVIVHNDVSGLSLGVAVDAHGAAPDTVYFNEDPRPFFLAVESENSARSRTAHA